MNWEKILKANDAGVKRLKGLVGKEGKLEDIMEMINKEFGVKTKIIYDSSSQPVLGFELPFYVRCEMGTRDNPSTTEEFTVKLVGINESKIK